MSAPFGLLKIIAKIKEIHGDTVHIDGTTYLSMKKICRFIDIEFGEWWALPANIIYLKNKHKERCARNRMNPIEDIRNRLFQKYGDLISIREESYRGSKKKCLFLDKDFGPFSSLVCDVINGHGHKKRGNLKREATCLNKYGYKHINQNPEISLKIVRSQNKIIELLHWKTGAVVPCQGSYEVAAVTYWNLNKIDFQWQINFRIPEQVSNIGGKTYRVDAYLPEFNKYIEIKGRFLNNSKQKWNWFHDAYPNSELWDGEKLKSLGIFPKYHRKKKT